MPQGASIDDVDRGVLARVFEFLSPNGIGCSKQVSRAWREVGNYDTVWATKARQLWPADTLASASYNSFQDLVLDGNRRGAVLCVPLDGVAPPSSYKYNQPDYYFECRLVALEWDRQADELRLFFDARGEQDLRHPITSSLAIAVPPAGPTTPLSSRHVLGSLRPTGCELLVKTPGHYRGWLKFEGVQHIEKLLADAAAAESQGMRSRLQRDGWGLYFVYANGVPPVVAASGRSGRSSPRLVWGSQFLDYHPVQVAAVPPPPAPLPGAEAGGPAQGGAGSPLAGVGLLGAALACLGQWQRPSQQEEAVCAEGPGVDTDRWAGLPPEVACRVWGGAGIGSGMH